MFDNKLAHTGVIGNLSRIQVIFFIRYLNGKIYTPRQTNLKVKVKDFVSKSSREEVSMHAASAQGWFVVHTVGDAN